MSNQTVIRIVLANLAVLIALAFLYPHLMISPGPLIEGHRDITQDCFACHSPFTGSDPARCVTCHKPEEIGRSTTKGAPIAHREGQTQTAFHQSLIEQDCVACHSDHQGVMPFRTVRTFSHELLAVEVRDDCAGCHQAPKDRMHKEIQGQCSQCHGQDAWRPATFDHDQYFRFDRHHETECATCHVDNDYKRYTCYGCHEHSRAKIREEHLEEGISDFENCVECHRSGDEDEAKSRGREGGGFRERKHEGRGHDDD